MTPSRIATALKRYRSTYDAARAGRPKKGEEKNAEAARQTALNAFSAQNLGVPLKRAKGFEAVFDSPLVPQNCKDLIDSGKLALATVQEAIKFAEEAAQRENRAPSSDDVLIYLKTPRVKKSSDTVREVLSQPPTAVAPPLEVVDEPPPEVVAPLESEENDEPDIDIGVHLSHCCKDHGCKYNDTNCPVVLGTHNQLGPCEDCIPDEEIPEPEYAPFETESEYAGNQQSPVERIASAQQTLKSALKEVNPKDEDVAYELLSIHGWLSSFLQGSDLIAPPMKIPTILEDQLDLCFSIVESIDQVEQPDRVRDLLLDLVSKTKAAIEKLTTVKRELSPNGLFCDLCFGPQFTTPSGASCKEGHGGVPGITEVEVRLRQAGVSTKDVAQEQPTEDLGLDQMDFGQSEPEVVAVPPPLPVEKDPIEELLAAAMESEPARTPTDNVLESGDPVDDIIAHFSVELGL